MVAGAQHGQRLVKNSGAVFDGEAGTIQSNERTPRSGARHDLVMVVEDGMTDLALLMLRVVTGGLLLGHGAQKLFGSFGGSGLGGTSAWMESMGLRPGALWALLAGLGELGGGLMTVLGLGGPLGSIL